MFGLALSTMASLFLCIFIGFIAAKRSIIDEQGIDRLNIFLLNVTFPFMMIGIFNIELTPEIIEKGVPIFIYGIIYQMILAVIAFAFTSVFDFGVSRIDTVGFSRNQIVRFLMIFTNTGFVGLPLIGSVLGAEGLLYASLLNIPFNIMCFTFGVYLLQPDGENHISLKSIFLTPAMIGIGIGLILLLSQLVIPGTFEVDGELVRLPVFMTKTINMVGGITSPLAMIIVGASLNKTNFKKVFCDWRLHIFSVLKLLIAPVITYFVCSLFIADPQILLIVTVFAGLPSATVGTILAERFGHDYVFASEVVFITTLYSLITIPLVFLIFT